MLLAEHREKSGLTQSQFAKRVKMQKTALSRLENHGEDVRLSTITRSNSISCRMANAARLDANLPRP
jgi:transcriptional regulator with XRE-family HTH domain